MSQLPASARVDLHLHSDRSDGRHPPEVVLARCAEARLDLIALTDHDLPPSLAPGEHEVGGRRLTLIHGCELTGVHEGHEQHLLVYFPGEMPAAFAALLRERARVRALRYDAARAALGLPGIPPADARALAGERALTRLHLGQAIQAAGHAASAREAFDRWLGDEHAHVPAVDLPFTEAIALARAAGGLTSWAHPQLARAQAWVATFAAAGLHAMEGLRPGTGASYRKAMRNLARKHGLLLSGGSDWHGWSPLALGDFALDGQQARPFLQALTARCG